MIAAAWLALALMATPEARLPEPPLGLDLYMPLPEDNPVSREKVVLGRKLFFDKRLSRDGTLACATCHDPRRAFSDGRVVARGTGGAEGARNSPAIVNRGYGSAFFWDGRAVTLERQVLEPIFSQKELGLTRPELERRTGLAAQQVAGALASYVRTIRPGGSRFDRYLAGKRDAFTETSARASRCSAARATASSATSVPTSPMSSSTIPVSRGGTAVTPTTAGTRSPTG